MENNPPYIPSDRVKAIVASIKEKAVIAPLFMEKGQDLCPGSLSMEIPREIYTRHLPETISEEIANAVKDYDDDYKAAVTEVIKVELIKRLPEIKADDEKAGSRIHPRAYMSNHLLCGAVDAEIFGNSQMRVSVDLKILPANKNCQSELSRFDLQNTMKSEFIKLCEGEKNVSE